MASPRICPCFSLADQGPVLGTGLENSWKRDGGSCYSCCRGDYLEPAPRRHTFIHNFAVTLWIASNSLWMLAEFYGREASLKPISTIGFLLGIFLLLAAYGHLFWKKKQVKTRKKA